ncbi:hypothetical protein JW916_11200 [Candidatus Sumerlaeota bacterium]|nr:hypothetical protein [Candidatus Sumerlaeota bacterium]
MFRKPCDKGQVVVLGPNREAWMPLGRSMYTVILPSGPTASSNWTLFE